MPRSRPARAARSAGTTNGRDSSRAEPAHGTNAGGASVWYRWTAPATGTVTRDASGSVHPALVAVYQGSAVDALMVVRRSDDTTRSAEAVTFPATAGVTYRIAIDGATTAVGATTLAWRMAPPANDALSAAAAVAGRTGEWRGSTVAATRESGEPNHAGVAGGRSVWFRWTSSQTESMTFTTAGSQFDTLLAVYSGSAVTSLTLISANNNADGLTTSRVALEAVAGRTYLIAVDGAAGAAGAAP